MSKITFAVAIFALGAISGYMTAPVSKAVAESQLQQVSIFELTQKAGVLPVESFDAI